MSDIRTQKLTRNQIAEIVGNNPRAILLLENLLADVADNIPSSIDEVELAMRFSLQAADGSKSASFNAQALAQEALALLHLSRAQASQIADLQRDVSELRTMLLTLRDQSAAIQQLRSDLDDVRAITEGT